MYGPQQRIHRPRDQPPETGWQEVGKEWSLDKGQGNGEDTHLALVVEKHSCYCRKDDLGR